MNFERQERLVRADVHLCLSGLVEHLQEKDEEAANLLVESFPSSTFTLRCDECGKEWESTDPDDVCPGCSDLGDHPVIDEDFPEIYEWWAVSEWLASKLEAEGECVVRDFWGVTLWGRQTTGQSIAMDHVIGEICRKLDAEYGVEKETG